MYGFIVVFPINEMIVQLKVIRIVDFSFRNDVVVIVVNIMVKVFDLDLMVIM